APALGGSLSRARTGHARGIARSGARAAAPRADAGEAADLRPGDRLGASFRRPVARPGPSALGPRGALGRAARRDRGGLSRPRAHGRGGPSRRAYLRGDGPIPGPRAGSAPPGASPDAFRESLVS